MIRQIKVKDLCNELEAKLVDLGYSEDSMRRYRKVFDELKEYSGDKDYSQSLGTDFLVEKFTEIYSKTSVKMKREALEKMDKKEVVPTDTKEWNEDTELMTWLKNL